MVGKTIYCTKCQVAVTVPEESEPVVTIAEPPPQLIIPPSTASVDDVGNPVYSPEPESFTQFNPKQKNSTAARGYPRRPKKKRSSRTVAFVLLTGLFLVFVLIGVIAYFNSIGSHKNYIKKSEQFFVEFKDDNRNFDGNIVGNSNNLGIVPIKNSFDPVKLNKKAAEELKLLEEIRDPTSDSSHDPIVSITSSRSFYRYAVWFTKDTRQIALVSSSKLEMWSLAQKRQTTSFSIRCRRGAADISPDRSKVAVGDSSGNMELISLDQKRTILRRTNVANSLYSLTFSPDGNRLAVSGRNLRTQNFLQNGFAFWDVNARRFTNFGIRHGSPDEIVFSPDQTEMVATSISAKAQMWKLNPWTRQQLLSQYQVKRMCYSPDGKRMAVLGRLGFGTHQLKLFRKGSNSGKRIYLSNLSQVDDITFSPSGRHLAVLTNDNLNLSNNRLRIVETSTGRTVKDMKFTKSTRIDFSPGGALLLVVGQGISVYDFEALLRPEVPRTPGKRKPLTEAQAVSRIRHWATIKKLSDGSYDISSGNAAIDSVVADVQYLPKVDRLNLQYGFTDRVFPYLKNIKHLKRLSLGSSSLHGPGLVHIKDLNELEELTIRFKMYDNDLRHLKNLTKLKKLQLSLFYSDNQITDRGLLSLKDLTNLEVLTLNRCKYLRGSGLNYLSGLTKLKSLSLYRSPISGQYLTHLKPLKGLEYLHLNYTYVDDRSLVHLKDMTNLRSLSLSGTRITDDGLKHLSGLKNLSYLSLDKVSGIRGHGFAHLKDLPKLKSVMYLWDTGLTDDGLKGLGELTQLETVSLPDRISDAGLKHLKGMTNLNNLNLYKTRVTGSGLAELKDLPNLQTLNLSRSRITDAGLANLKGWKSLRSLSLEYTNISDAGLQNLRDLPNLKTLRLRNTRVSYTEMSRLRKMFPGIYISR